MALALSAMFPAEQTRTAKTLDVYVVDVEGGNATLFVSPSGESMLIDSGNAGAAAVRDADRIMAAVKDAGLSQIDNLITTHWHMDHYGGVARLALFGFDIGRVCGDILRRTPAVTKGRMFKRTPSLRSGSQPIGCSSIGFQRTKMSYGGSPSRISSSFR